VVSKPMAEPKQDPKLDEMINAYKMKVGIPVPYETTLDKIRKNDTSPSMYLNKQA
jgi:hypothetical protein